MYFYEDYMDLGNIATNLNGSHGGTHDEEMTSTTDGFVNAVAGPSRLT